MDRVPLERMVDNPFQVRQVYDEDGIVELANSILQMREARPETSGLIQVPVGRIVLGDFLLDPGKYESVAACLDANPRAVVQLAAGHRRLRAFVWLYNIGEGDEYETLPVEIQALDDQAMADIAWEENMKRKDLSPIEEAEALRQAMESFGWSQAEVGERRGLSQPAVANKLRLLQLPADAQAAIRSGQLGERHGRALLRALGKSRRIYERVAEEIIPLPVDEQTAMKAREIIGDRHIFAISRHNITDPDDRRCWACGGPLGQPASGVIPAIHVDGEYQYFCLACTRAGQGWVPPSTAETENLVERAIQVESNKLDPNDFPLNVEIGSPPRVQAAKCVDCELQEERHWCLDSRCFLEKKKLWYEHLVLRFQEMLRNKFRIEELPEIITGWSGNDHSIYSTTEKAMVDSGHCGPHCSRLRFRYSIYKGIRPVPEMPFIYNCDNTNAKNACIRRYLKSLETAEQQEAAQQAKKAAEVRRKEARALLHRAEVSVARALKAGHEGVWQKLAKTVGEETKEGQSAEVSVGQVAKALLQGERKMDFVDWENEEAMEHFRDAVVDVALRWMGVGLVPSVEDLEEKLRRMSAFLVDVNRGDREITSVMVQGNRDNLAKIVIEISDLSRDGLMKREEFERIIQWVEELGEELEDISREMLVIE